MKVKMPRKARPGRTTGSATCQYWRRKPAPSSREASISSSWIALFMYWRIQKMPNALAAAGTIRAGIEPIQPSLAMMTNCGMADSWAGTMKIAIISPKSALRPGKWNLAKTKAASESKNRTRKVTVTATSSEFHIDPKKSMASKRWRVFSRKWEPGSSFGGYENISDDVCVDMITAQ